MKYGYHPEALSEYAAAASFYEERRQGLGAEFVDEVEMAVQRVLAGPGRWPRIEPDIRKCRLNRFPYGLLYAEEAGAIKIIAIMHFSRKPGYWRERVGRWGRMTS